jgi:ribose 5-phosphate isomerase A
MGVIPMTIYECALDYVADGDVVGLGSGHASSDFIRLLGQRVRAGLRVKGVPTSKASADLATSSGIPLVTLAEALPLSVTVDGADEVDPNLDMIKGYGRALVREKIVAAASRQLVILVGPGKEVSKLGQRGKLPVEVLPFAMPLCVRRLKELGLDPVPYQENGKLFVTDNGNHILDCGTGQIAHPGELDAQIEAIPGVVGTGLFIGMADVVLVGDEHFNLIARKSREDLPDEREELNPW